VRDRVAERLELAVRGGERVRGAPREGDVLEHDARAPRADREHLCLHERARRRADLGDGDGLAPERAAQHRGHERRARERGIDLAERLADAALHVRREPERRGVAEERAQVLGSLGLGAQRPHRDGRVGGERRHDAQVGLDLLAPRSFLREARELGGVLLGDVDREDARAARHRSDAQLEGADRSVRERERVREHVRGAVGQRRADELEHRRRVDPRIALRHRAAEQRLPRRPPVACSRVVDVDVPIRRVDDLDALRQRVEHGSEVARREHHEPHSGPQA
jgi:hypothetical protein